VLAGARRCARLRALARRQERAWSRLMQQLGRRQRVARRLLGSAPAAPDGTGSRAPADVEAALAALDAPLDAAERARREWELERALGCLIDGLRGSGALAADAGLRRMEHDLVEVEDHIHYLRRYHNAVVRDLQQGLDQVSPHCLARFLRVKPHALFQPEAAFERQIARARRGC